MKNETYTAEVKKPYELENCTEGSRIVLVYNTGEQFHGVFRGMDGDDIIKLRSEGEKPITMGFTISELEHWLLKD